MSVNTDFLYLKRRASNQQDLAHLDEIQKDRQAILKDNAIIHDSSTYGIVLNGMKFSFQRNLAPSTVDTYIEIFRERKHMRHQRFEGKNDRLVLDIGAHEGFYSIRMKQNNPKLHIVAIEPMPQVFRLLNRNIALNALDGIHTIEKAVSETNGMITLQTYPHVSSISSVDLSLLERSRVQSERITSVSVESIPLKNLLGALESVFPSSGMSEIDLVKIDTEGSELRVLRSAGGAIRTVRKIVVECHTPWLAHQCRQLLEAYNFELVFEEQTRFADMYFIQKKYL